jgi:hypothetical protein
VTGIGHRLGKAWSRIHGVRANASRWSHAELDESDVLDPGDFGRRHFVLRRVPCAFSAAAARITA